jgi:uncharacterized protein YbbK (DUF523 family)
MRTFAHPNIVISKCMGFAACRYNGVTIPDAFVQQLEPFVTYLPVCAEVEIGLGVPRDPVRIVLVNDEPRLLQPATGADMTEKMQTFSAAHLDSLSDIDGFILKGRSPSCGIKDVKLYRGMEKGAAVARKGNGFFAQAVLERYGHLPVEEEGRLTNFTIREHFLTALFALADFRAVKASGAMGDLVRFTPTTSSCSWPFPLGPVSRPCPPAPDATVARSETGHSFQEVILVRQIVRRQDHRHMPRSRLMCRMNWRMRSLATTSRPMVGSSRNSSGVVQQRGAQIGPHPLAQRERAHRRVEERFQVQQRGTHPGCGGSAPAGFCRCAAAGPATRSPAGPTTGRPLAEHRADFRHVRAALLPRHAPVDDDLAAGGHEQAGEHLERRRFPRAVWPHVAHQLAGFDGEADVVHRAHHVVRAREQVPHRAERAPVVPVDCKVLGQVLDFDDHIVLSFQRSTSSLRRSVFWLIAEG